MEHDTACGPFRERLIEFAAGLLPADERLDVERHLETCAACREELAEWRAMGGGLAALDSRIPADTRAVDGWGRLSAALANEDATAVDGGATSAQVYNTAMSESGELENTTIDQDDFHDRRNARSGSWQQRPPRRGRISGITAVAAALLVAVLGAAIFGAFGRGHVGTESATPTATIVTTPTESPTPTAAPTTPPQASACPAGKTTFSGVTGVYMESISMLSATEGWAAVLQGSPLHFSDCHWTPETEVTNLTGISMLSATDGWAIGFDATNPIYHYVGGHWVRQPAVDAYDGSSYLAIRMESPTDGWIIGANPKDTQSRYTFFALHYDGSSWSRANLPIHSFFDVAAVGADEAWIAGSDASGDTELVHDVAGTFTTYIESNGNFRSFQVNSPDDIWLVGWYPLAYDYFESSGVYVLHYDGANWQRVPMSSDPSVQQGKGFFIFSSSDAWAFPAPISQTNYTPISGARRLTPAGWQTVVWPFTDLVGVDQMVEVGPDEYWALANAWQTTQSGVGSGSAEYRVLLHYADGQWTEYGHV